MTNMKPLVSILCIAYNQEKYIKQAITSFLMQRVNFSYEIIIHDDASNDGTREIIQEFVNDNPKIFRPILETENRYSKSGVLFLKEMYQMARGKYIAVCEGDDFWTDITKLQRQVDFMEKNQDHSIVFHPVRIMYEGGEEQDSIFPEISKKSYFSLENLLKTNFIHTNSFLYRRQKYENINQNVMPIDWYMHLFHAQFGKIGFINREMAVYRRHDAGIWWGTSSQGDIDGVWKKYGVNHLVLYAELLKIYGNVSKYRDIIDRYIGITIQTLNRIDLKEKTNLVGTYVEKYMDSPDVFLSLSRTIGKMEQENEKTINILKEEINKLQDQNRSLQQHNIAITHSLSWKVTKPLRAAKKITKSIKRHE